MGSLFEENDFDVEEASHQLALIRWIFDNVTEFCLVGNTLPTRGLMHALALVAKSPGLPSSPPPESREENPFRIVTIHPKPLHPLSFLWKRVSGCERGAGGGLAV
ncbi:hypothetical protein CEXT_26391 [Caerostris extrusa]|uniref:Uncharacterized protein n=1 Tax=Caerostris extrusa TaxID=172846 RepID=A0AAV4VDK0_CAEEX|nr:hypothetical protein CEXT_26391 [Caerostris extrusa]